MSDHVQGTEQALEALKKDLKAVIIGALEKNVTSQSNVGGQTITGNRYQTIALGDSMVAGFRDRREDLFAGLDLTGKCACDLGANLGEIARDLARRGADRVDAYEYDRFFTMLGSLISAYRSQTNVIHYAADVSQIGFMRRDYDVCAALAVYAYIEQITDYVSEHIREFMVTETHEVDQHWHKRYVDRVAAHFPHWGCFGVIKHGDTTNANKRRLRLIFSKREALDAFYVRRNQELGCSGADVAYLNIRESNFPFLARAAGILEGDANNRLSATRLAKYRKLVADYEAEFQAGNAVELSVVGEVYWLSFVLGMVDYRNAGKLVSDNVYLTWLRRSLQAQTGDPGWTSYLADESELVRMVDERLRDFSRLLEINGQERSKNLFQPMVAYNPTPDHPTLRSRMLAKLSMVQTGEVLCVPTIDGHHRLFMCNLLDCQQIGVRMYWDPSFLRFSSSRATGSNYTDRIIEYLAGMPVSDPIFT